jgi:tRNA/rRNA methyltransferase
MNGTRTSGPDALSRIRVVLVEPAHPGNIGAAARALKTMGLARLVLVRPKAFPHREARVLASKALDVLDETRVCATLDEALEGTVLSVAMSARGRDLSHPVLQARAAAAEIALAARDTEVAIVFGHETAGLSNEDVLKCGRLAWIPASAEYSSLNLAQAVQVMTYEVRLAAAEPAPPRGREPEYASHSELESFYGHLEASIVASGFLDAGNPRRLMERMRRMFARARLEREEVNVLRGMLTAWDEGSKMRPKKRDPGENS